MKQRSVLLALSAACCVSLTSCVKFYEFPKDYSGPTATVRDSSRSVSLVKAEVFRVRGIDGLVPQQGPMATPYGAGAAVTLRESIHKIPAKPVTLSLSAEDAFAADGALMIDKMAGNSNASAEGELSFTPKPGGVYVVKGMLGKESSSVWLEEVGSGHRIGQKFVTE